jgi:aminoglycoside phosphotransferase (APT) family kinase protein
MTSIATSVKNDHITAIVREYLAASGSVATDVEIQWRDAGSNGFSNITELFDAWWHEDGEDRSKGFVLRTQPAGGELFYDTPLLFQWQMMEAIAQRSDIPVPRLVQASADGGPLGAPFFVMEAVEGRVPLNGTGYHGSGWVSELAPEDRSRLATNAIAALAEIHSIPWQQGFEFLDRPERGDVGLDQYLRYQEQWYEWAAKGRSFPVIDQGLRWLRDHQPADPRVCISWGDARVGNIIFGTDQSVCSVIDWEQATLGPPEMDVAWWLMFEELFTASQGIVPLAGIPDKAALVDAYEQASGRTLEDLTYYEVLAWVRITITCLRMIAPNPGDDETLLSTPYLTRLAEVILS